MKTVNTVLGPIDIADLGFTLAHEHVQVGTAGTWDSYPELLGPNRMERVLADLKGAKEGGVKTIVDATTLDLGRNVGVMVEASRRSGVNIIGCSGWWLDVPRFFGGISSDQLVALFARDVEQGYRGTNVKAGVLKAASDLEGVTPQHEVILRGVARAHLKTGVPIMLHSYSPGRVGQRQVAILKEEGVNLNRVKFDHSDDTADVDYLLWLLEQGCYLGMDRFPGRRFADSVVRTRTLKALIDAGYADRICPSHDRAILHTEANNPPRTEKEMLQGRLTVIPGKVMNQKTEEERLQGQLRDNPYGYLYLTKVVFPQLREMGVSETVLSGLCVNGPRNFFEGN